MKPPAKNSPYPPQRPQRPQQPSRSQQSQQPQPSQPRDSDASSDLSLFPMRINKYLALEGRGSRREMDKLIAEGRVSINGREAVLGDKVNEGDKVEIKFRAPRRDF